MKMPLMRLNVITNAELEGVGVRIRCGLLLIFLSLGACSNEVPEAAVVPLQGGVLEAVVQPGTPKWATFLSFSFLKKPKAGRCWSGGCRTSHFGQR